MILTSFCYKRKALHIERVERHAWTLWKPQILWSGPWTDRPKNGKVEYALYLLRWDVSSVVQYNSSIQILMPLLLVLLRKLLHTVVADFVCFNVRFTNLRSFAQEIALYVLHFSFTRVVVT